jgi:hypothetical protein
MGIKTTQNFADFETVEKNVKNLLTKKLKAKKNGKNLSSSSSILLTYKSVWQRTFSWWTFFQLFPHI